MSTNISKEKREILINKIKQIKQFIEKSPQDENTINLLSYIADIEKDIKGKKYGLIFEEHSETIDEILKTHTPVLTEEIDLFIDNGGQMNFLIEGDNLASLQLLEKTHKGKIDIIYIDPPYNTGNKDFIYDDNYVDKSDSFRHSKWLSFMGKRLMIARNVLSNNGVIFISIDDNEQAQLKILCDDVFGTDNFYGELIQLKGNTQNDSKSIQRNHEYIMCYTKTQNPLLLTYYSQISKEVFEDNYYKGRDTGASSGHDKPIERANLGYTIYYFESTINGATGNHNKLIERANLLSKKYGDYNYYISKDKRTFIHAIAVADYDISKIEDNSLEEDIYTDIVKLITLGYKKIRPPKRKGGKLGCWTWGIKKFQEYWNNNEVLIKNYKNVIKKEFINNDAIVIKNGKKFYVQNNVIPLKSVIDITNSKGTTILKGDNGIIPGCDFQNPKNPELLEYLIKAYRLQDNYSNPTILDFFAGSGTTGHAVMKLNSEDGGNRKFILCTNNENNICRDVTYERIKRVIERNDYTASLKYMKVDFVPISDKLYYEYADELLKHIKELVELENGINFDDNKELSIILTEKELDDFTNNLPKECKIIYLGHDVLPTEEQESLFKEYDIKVNIIPDYYYRDLEG